MGSSERFWSSSSDVSMASTAVSSEATDGFYSCTSPHVWFNDAQTTVHPISPCRQAQGRYAEAAARPPPPKPVQLTPRPPLEMPTGRALIGRHTLQQQATVNANSHQVHVPSPCATAQCVIAP